MDRPALPLPDFALSADPLGGAFRQVGVDRFGEAALFVHGLPYGRNSDRADYRRVLPEGRGTCSTKHALLAALAREQDVAIELRVGIYAMSEANTPGVGSVLAAHGLTEIPEAHCYLVAGGPRVDLTHPSGDGICALAFAEEHVIRPEDIGEPKVALHRNYLARWSEARGLSLEASWAIREACIAALSRCPTSP